MKTLVRFLTISSIIFLSSASTAVSGPPGKRPKTFAVFSANFNPTGNKVIGGVCGAVFFVNANTAITAYHVLQPASFKTQTGFQKVRLWLVHEDFPAIEVHPQQLTYMPDRDLTIIHVGAKSPIPTDFVYPSVYPAEPKSVAAPAPPPEAAPSTPPQTLSSWSGHVETDGFVASSAGPILARMGEEIVVTSVPRLDRLHLEGEFVQAANVNLSAKDVNLKSAPCLKLSYQPIVGISGGPVVADGRVIGVNSFADPVTLHSTWAQQIRPLPKM